MLWIVGANEGVARRAVSAVEEVVAREGVSVEVFAFDFLREPPAYALVLGGEDVTTREILTERERLRRNLGRALAAVEGKFIVLGTENMSIPLDPPFIYLVAAKPRRLLNGILGELAINAALYAVDFFEFALKALESRVAREVAETALNIMLREGLVYEEYGDFALLLDVKRAGPPYAISRAIIRSFNQSNIF